MGHSQHLLIILRISKNKIDIGGVGHFSKVLPGQEKNFSSDISCNLGVPPDCFDVVELVEVVFAELQPFFCKKKGVLSIYPWMSGWPILHRWHQIGVG